MVIKGDLEIQLVYADTKIPLKEHAQFGTSTIYAEAEPDADYFIAIRRRGETGPRTIVTEILVDGKELNYYHWWTDISNEFSYDGIYNEVNGREKHTALKFQRARSTESPTYDERFIRHSEVMGKVEVVLFEGVPDESIDSDDESAPQSPPRSRIKKHVPTAITPDDSIVVETDELPEQFAKKKFVLSVPGTTTIHNKIKNQPYEITYSPGRFIGAVTLHYCSVVGLIEVGLLPPPPRYVFMKDRMISPPSQSTRSEQCCRPVKRVKHVNSSYCFMGSVEVDQFELSSDSDSDSDDSDSDEDD